MAKDKILKMLLFNLGLVLVDILLFSNAFLHIDMSGNNPLTLALGVMAIVMSLALFGVVNYRFLSAGRTPYQPLMPEKSILTLDDCAASLQHYVDNNVKTFAEQLKTVIVQIGRMKKRMQTVQNILSERFSQTEMSFGRFHEPVMGMEKIMLLNGKSLLNRVNAFDEEEYEDILKKTAADDRINATRLGIFNEYKSFVDRSVENNEEILLRLDKLILELSKLNDLNEGTIEDMDAVKEIDALIHDAKWYK